MFETQKKMYNETIVKLLVELEEQKKKERREWLAK